MAIYILWHMSHTLHLRTVEPVRVRRLIRSTQCMQQKLPIISAIAEAGGGVRRTVSNDTRVRMDGLVNIMAMVFPANGLKVSSRAASRSLTAVG